MLLQGYDLLTSLVGVNIVCINQNDIRERRGQVSIMGKIYQLANEVIVWLGAEKDESNLAINFIKTQSRTPARKFLPSIGTNTDPAIELQPILELMKRDYWQRAWIIQEVFQARMIIIHCGFHTLFWADLAKFFRLVEHRVMDTKNTSIRELDGLYNATAFRLTKDRTSKNRDLHNLLQRYKDSLCSDPRDKVFSLCGMSNNNRWLVDYSRSTPDVFRLLCGFGNGDPKRLHRVRIAQVIQKALGLSFVWPKSYRISGPTSFPPNLACTYSHRNLVANLSPNFPMEEPALLTWYNKFRGPNVPSLVRVKESLQALNIDDLRLLTSFRHIRNVHQEQNPQQQERHQENVRDGSYEAASLPGSLTDSHLLRLFTTHNGRLGFACFDIAIEDIIVHFAGCDVAWVFRSPYLWSTISFLPPSAEFKGRVLIIKSDRWRSRYMPEGDAEYRYAIPDSEDTFDMCDRIMDADVGEGRRREVVRGAATADAYCTIDQLRFWIW
jgi:Heterokaryon incompatibility protein (HET)